MDIKQIRERNLIELLDHLYDGEPANLSRALDQTTSSQISRYTSTSDKTWRPIGDAMARQIETVSNKPAGWLDRVHDGVADNVVQYKTNNPEDLAEEKALFFADEFERNLEIRLSSHDKRELFKRMRDRYLRQLLVGQNIPMTTEEMEAEVIEFAAFAKQ